jgi:hypothetical protein
MRKDRKQKIEAFALKLLVTAGYVPLPRLKQALKIATRCEKQS